MLEELEHYMIDFYAFLGIERDADEDTIRSALRIKTKEYHTDRYQDLAPELKAQADQKMRVVNLARETLSDAEKRAEYDKQLAEWDGPISLDGHPIIDLSKPYFSATRLLSGAIEDPDITQRREEMARQFSGYDFKTFSLLERLYRESSPPSQDLEAAYREALRKRDLYLAIQSKFMWEVLGCHNRPSDTQLTTSHAVSTEEELTRAQSQIEADVENKIALVQGGALKVLGPVGEDVTQDIIDNPKQALACYQGLIKERFEAGAGKIRQIAREREEVIGQRMKLLQYQYWPEQNNFFPHLLACLRVKEQQLWMAFQLKGVNTVESDDSIDTESLATLTSCEEEAKGWVERGYNILLVNLEENLSYLEQLKTLLSQHFERLPKSEVMGKNEAKK